MYHEDELDDISEYDEDLCDHLKQLDEVRRLYGMTPDELFYVFDNVRMSETLMRASDAKTTTDESKLSYFAKDVDEEVRAAVAGNENTSTEVLQQLAKDDPSEAVKQYASTRLNSSKKSLEASVSVSERPYVVRQKNEQSR